MAKMVIQKYKNIYNEIVVVAEKYSIAKVFYDFIEMMALEIAIKNLHSTMVRFIIPNRDNTNNFSVVFTFHYG